MLNYGESIKRIEMFHLSPDGSVVIIGPMNTVVRLKQEFLVYFAFLEKINLLCSQCHSMDEAVSEAEN